MRRIAAAVARLSPGTAVHDLPGGTGQVLALQPGVAIAWRRVGGLIAVSNDPAAGRTPPAALETSSAWRAFAAQARIPARVGFLAYLNVHGLLQGVEPVQNPDAAHVGGVAVWTTSSPAGAHLDAYLQVLR
jgi:hypothetical protein